MTEDDIRKVQSSIRSTKMKIIQGGPDLDLMATRFVGEWTGWLASVNLTPQQFCAAMRDFPQCDVHEQLGITQGEFQEGIDSIGTLGLYALILGISGPAELWRGFEAHRYTMPRWLKREAEQDLQAHMSDSFARAFGNIVPPRSREGPSVQVAQQLDEKVAEEFARIMVAG